MKFKYLNLLFASLLFVTFIRLFFYLACLGSGVTCSPKWLIFYGILTIIVGAIALWKRKE
jgi:hypothetical protein